MLETQYRRRCATKAGSYEVFDSESSTLGFPNILLLRGWYDSFKQNETANPWLWLLDLYVLGQLHVDVPVPLLANCNAV